MEGGCRPGPAQTMSYYSRVLFGPEGGSLPPVQPLEQAACYGWHWQIPMPFWAHFSSFERSFQLQGWWFFYWNGSFRLYIFLPWSVRCSLFSLTLRLTVGGACGHRSPWPSSGHMDPLLVLLCTLWIMPVRATGGLRLHRSSTSTPFVSELIKRFFL